MTSDRTISTILRSTLWLLDYYDMHPSGGRAPLADLKACLQRTILELGGDESRVSDDFDDAAMRSMGNRSVASFANARQDEC
jgi:hypothetical protein